MGRKLIRVRSPYGNGRHLRMGKEEAVIDRDRGIGSSEIPQILRRPVELAAFIRRGYDQDPHIQFPCPPERQEIPLIKIVVVEIHRLKFLRLYDPQDDLQLSVR